jgi:ADP-heptose:LPS heptosyltransferase
LARLLSALPGYHFMVLGDASEQGMVKQMPVNERIHYAFDAFDLDQLPAVIAASALHLGGDSALMHLAGCLGVPTVTVWGGSDPQMYGWHRINPHKHAILYNHPQCGPCSRWLLPNTTRVTHASDCPDFACIRQLSADSIASAALKMMEK